MEARRVAHTLGLRRVVSTPLITLAVFLLALAPRVLAQGRFITVDEAYHWFERAHLFLRAIRAGDWASTNLIGHPGVTTMWLGALGIVAHQTLAGWGLATWPDPELLRVMLRLPVAIVTALCVALSYPLLRRLLSTRVAILAALLWAADPFLVAHSQLLHVDALMTSFITLSLLTALVAFRLDDDAEDQPVRWRMLIASAVAGGLALLTKSPAVILLPMIGLIALAAAWRRNKGRRTKAEGRAHDWRSLAFGFRGGTIYRALTSFVILPVLAWVGVMAAIWFTLWPAAWVDLSGAVGSVLHQAEADGGSPHGWGNFFFGHTVDDPGPLFYPIASALRLTPWALLGLLAYFGFTIYDIRSRRRLPIGDRTSQLVNRREHRAPLALLALFVLLFTLMMSVPAKKFDRYILPIFPPLDILAAVGLIWLMNQRTKNQEPRIDRPDRSPVLGSRSGTLWVVLGWSFVVLALAANLAWYHPYELAYYNPLLGGGPIAARLIPVGWGEGLEQAGAYIQAQPDGADRPVATWYRPALKPYVSAPMVPLSWVLEPGKVGYAVLYIDQVQRDDEAAATDMLRSQLTPIHIVRIHGIDYAEIYQLPPPVGQSLDADFGPAIHFRGYDVNTAEKGVLMLTVYWQARAPIADDYLLFTHVLDANGTRVGGIDGPPGGVREPTSAWRPGSYISATLRVPIGADTPPGTYWIAIGLYEPRTGERRSLRAAPRPYAPADGENALLLEPLSLK
jgi:4-amino-4-deoxy-L-arabinose transferase-like glycosyltransferase